ncbi:MAG: AzlC family ABC transporter permease [Actinomycetota bacterium]|jgi:predicted branched-subunit amino acid permease|nr:AzlC family ABC transporter permease [Actinomycetota bacterium]MDA3015352.1 AzlC family ABC transporter permease [Actinomycetota bacterium]MDA3028689.1 AzlC family ABC transporter permease [Actinomycetota bacterium]
MADADLRVKPDWGVLTGIAFTFFALGVTVNVLVLERVGSEIKTVVAAIVVNSATSELAYLAVRDAGGSVLAALIAGWVVASRFGLLAAGLGGRLQVGRLHRALAGLQSFDPNVGVAVQQPTSHGVMRVFWMVTLAMHAGWWSGTFVGVFLGNIIGDADRLGLDAVFPALMLAVIGNLLRQRQGMTAALAGGGLCAVLVPIAPAGVPIIVSLVGAAIAMRVRVPEGTT